MLSLAPVASRSIASFLTGDGVRHPPGVLGHLGAHSKLAHARGQLRRFQHRLFVASDAAPVWIVEATPTGAPPTGGQLWMR